MRRHIDPLTGIRGVASGWVVLLHIQLLLPALLPPLPILGALVGSGNLGVDLFFLLSGFVITYTYLDRLGRGTPGAVRRFFILRFARIYPAHLATLLLVVALVAVSSAIGSPPHDERRFSLLSFIMNLFMLQAVPPALSWNDPAWSISAEFLAYLFFPLAVPVLARLTARSAGITAAVILSIGVPAMGIVVATADEWVYWSGYVLIWLRIAVAFPVGCLLYVVWRSRPPGEWARWGGAISLTGVIGVIAACLLTPPARALTLPVWAYPFLALLIFGLASALGWISRLLSTRVMVWSGKISYSVYLIHFPIVLLTVTLLERMQPLNNPALRIGVLLCLLGAVIGAGAALFYVVEEPARRAIRALAERRATSRPDAGTPQPE